MKTHCARLWASRTWGQRKVLRGESCCLLFNVTAHDMQQVAQTHTHTGCFLWSSWCSIVGVHILRRVGLYFGGCRFGRNGIIRCHPKRWLRTRIHRKNLNPGMWRLLKYHNLSMGFDTKSGTLFQSRWVSYHTRWWSAKG